MEENRGREAIDPDTVLQSRFKELSEKLENEKERLYRDVKRFRTVTSSPLVLSGGKLVTFYQPHMQASGKLDEYMKSVSSSLYFSILHGTLLECPKCLVSIYGFWEADHEGSRIMKDHVGNLDRLQKMRKAFSSVHNRWRKDFLKSSGSRCKVCGHAEDLELAHITPVEDFFYMYRKGRRLRHPSAKYLGVEFSYRNDNLMILCTRCHDAQTMKWPLFYAIEDPEKFLDLLHRRHEVLDLFEEIMEKRGWRTAEDLHQQKLF